MEIYTGNAAYCYANSLHMCLAAADRAVPPEPWFLECLTLAPFGAFLTGEGESTVFIPGPWRVDPDRGLGIAVDTLGWRCEAWHGDADTTAAPALARLRAAAKTGMVLIGPLDLGWLTYNPRHAEGTGADHFVVVLAVEDDAAVVHDPQGFPFAVLPLADLVAAWRAERIDYAAYPFKLRSAFRPDAPRTRAACIERSVSLPRETLLADAAADAAAVDGPAAFRAAAAALAGEAPASLIEILRDFSLRLGARRCHDGARFLVEGGQDEAASLMRRKAALYGRGQSAIARDRLAETARLLSELADLEDEFLGVLSRS